MGLGSTAKKLQQLADVAEKLYAKVNEVLDRLSDLRDRVEETSDRVEAMERELEEQRAIVEALAEEQGVDAAAAVAAVRADRGVDQTSGNDEEATTSTGDDGEPADAEPGGPPAE